MKGNELKPRIGLFGRRNVGKSSLINYLTQQQIAIVDNTAGTTTDPVRKSMEIGGIGPVILIDTAGIDDEGPLGKQRVEKSIAALAEVDLALLLFTQWGEPEQHVVDYCSKYNIKLLKIKSKNDLDNSPTECDLSLSTLDPSMRLTLIETIKHLIPESAYHAQPMLQGIVAKGDTVVLVTPIDSSAPEGRMILPQVQVLRHLMDLHAHALFCQPQELPQTLQMLRSAKDHNPQSVGNILVITDSQAFAQVSAIVPTEVPLTSFSMVLARQKGPFQHYIEGTQTIGRLRDGNRVLLLESCTHNVTCEDIGRVKLPALLRQATGKKIEIDILGGSDPISNAPHPVADYALIVQCGGCVITRQQIQARLQPALDANVPVSNYGMALAWCKGIFDRAAAIFKTNQQ